MKKLLGLFSPRPVDFDQVPLMGADRAAAAPARPRHMKLANTSLRHPRFKVA
jgi:hypothetical protein